MRICYLCDEYPPLPHGGIGTFAQVLGQAMSRRGHEICAIGVYPGAGRDVDVTDGPIRVVRLSAHSRRGGWIAERWRLYRAVARWCRRGEIDLVEAPDARGWTAFWPRLGVPLVCRLHGSLSFFEAEDGRNPSWLLYRLERSSLRRADYCCSVSRYAAERTVALMGAIPAGAPEVLYNGVELSPCPNQSERVRDRVVYTGTLVCKKGALSLVRAWPEVVRRHPQAELHLLGRDGRAPGGGSMQALLQAQPGGRPTARVVFHGHTPHPQVLAMLRTARVAVFPSYAETFGLAPAEAMACACPTIYSRRGPGPELIRDGVDGLLVDPDDPQEIATAIGDVLSDDLLAQRLGQAGRKRMEAMFSIEDIATRNEEYYARCIEDFRRRRG